MCQPAPVASAAWRDDQARYGNRVSFLGIVGDQAHQARTSGHNCGLRQESPVNGVDYPDGYAHAGDTGVASAEVGLEIVNARVRDPRVRYCIFRGVGYYGHHYRPPGPGGVTRTFRASGHPDHVHTSYLPWATFDTSPFYAAGKLTKTQLLYWWLWAGKEALRKPFLRPGSELMPGNTAHIKAVQKAFGLTQTGTYGPATVAKVKAFQEFLSIPHRGPAGRMNRRTWQWLIYDVFTRGRR